MGSVHLASFIRSRTGGVTIMAAVMMTTILATLALAIDTASFHVERRKAQSAADLAALAGASDIASAASLVAASLADNGYGAAAHEVVLGRYEADPARQASSRFTAEAEPVNAVSVVLKAHAPLYFGAALLRTNSVPTGARAIAVNTRLASFSIGSRLARLDAGILNQFMGSILGTELSLSIMDYTALLDAQIDIFEMLDALTGQLNISAANYDEVLDARIELKTLLQASATVLSRGDASDRQAAQALDAIMRALDRRRLDVGELFDLGPVAHRMPGADDAVGLAAAVSAFDLIQTAARVAGGSSMIELGTGLDLAGLASVEAYLVVGERPQGTRWLAIGEAGTTVHTAQTRLFIEARIGGSGLLSGTSLRIPLYAEIAAGTARLAEIECRPLQRGVVVAGRPGIAEFQLADIDRSALPHFGSDTRPREATIAQIPLATIRATARLTSGNESETRLFFTQDDITDGRTQSLATTDYTTSLVGALMHDLMIDVSLAGLGLGLGGLSNLAGSLLAGATGPLDTLLDTILLVAGIRLGEIDILVGGMRCDGAALVS